MALLTHGPRLGDPRADGFKVWVRADGAATVKLETRLTGTTTWSLADTQPIDTAKYNTAVLSATGLLAATKYDYRILFDDVQVASYYTITMPGSAGGRFVVYQVSDHHANNVLSPVTSNITHSLAFALSDWQANFEPLGVPAIVIGTGDVFNTTATGVANDPYTDATLQVLQHGVPGMAHLPTLFMWDDHDFAGDNSTSIELGAGVVRTLADVQAWWDRLWRDHPRPAAPSFAWEVVIAGVPFIATDRRAACNMFRLPTSVANPGFPSDWANNRMHEAFIPGVSPYTALGTAQVNWLVGRLQAYARTKAMIVLISTTTFSDQIAGDTIEVTHNRDSLGSAVRAERNYVLNEGLIRYGAGSKNNLVVWSGDDHRNAVFLTTAGAAPRYAVPGLRGAPLGLRFPEFKVTSGANIITGSVDLFGYGQLFDWSGTAGPVLARACAVVWDITSSHGGAHVTARATYRHHTQVLTTPNISTPPGYGGVPTASHGNGIGEAGDFYFKDGWFGYYADAPITQKYPVENSAREKPAFQRAFVDDVLGTLHSYDEVTRDQYGRLRRRDDVDELDRDDLHRRIDPENDPPLR